MPQKLANIFQQMDGGIAGTLRNCQLLSLWGQIVDGRVGRNTEAVKIRNHTLFVATANVIWAQELGFLRKEFVDKFNRVAGGDYINDIRFKAGGFNG